MGDHHSLPKQEKRTNISAGLLIFRRAKIDIVEFLLVHPGGPFWKNKDHGAWSIPKGQVESGEDLLARAQIEFEEEIGIKPEGDCVPLGSIKQKVGNTLHAWGFDGGLPQ